MSRFSNIVTHLLLHGVFLTAVTAQTANVTNSPQSVNISLNRVAEFNCTGVASGFVWEADGVEVKDDGMDTLISQVISVGASTMSTLRMKVTSTDNATNITCTALKLTPLSSDKSPPALLLVQGYLESVSNLTVISINSTTVLISWIPPFTLEGVPILGYNVTQINTNSGKSEMFVEGDTTMLYYFLDSTVNTFTISVIAINAAGSKESAIATASLVLHHISTTSFVLSTSTVESVLYTSQLLQTNSVALTSTATSVYQVYTTLSSRRVSATTTPISQGNITISVVVLSLIVVIIFAVMIILVLAAVAIMCCLYHKKNKTVVIKKSMSIPILSSANPAYDHVNVTSPKQQDNLKKTSQVMLSSNPYPFTPEYVDIDELNIKPHSTTTTADDTYGDTAEGDYEVVDYKQN